MNKLYFNVERDGFYGAYFKGKKDSNRAMKKLVLQGHPRQECLL